jgi:hypothetical protein
MNQMQRPALLAWLTFTEHGGEKEVSVIHLYLVVVPL